MRTFLTLILILSLASSCLAIDLDIKHFINYQDGNINDTERLRLRIDQNITSDLSLSAHYEIAGYTGKALSSAARNVLSQTKPYFLGLDGLVKSGDDYLIKQRVDRLNLKCKNWTIGRDAVSLGVGRIWVPNDVFEPFGPTEIDKDYKTGVDIIKYDYSPTDISNITLIYAPIQNNKSYYVSSFSQTFMGFQTSFIAGQVQNNTRYGIGFDGPVGGAGFRGSIAYTLPQNQIPVYTYIIGSNYMFPNNLYVLGEYYYNGFGNKNPSNYDWASYFNGSIFSLAQNYLALGTSLDFWSLWNTQTYIISNLDDNSRLYWEEISYSISDESSIQSGIMLTSGANNSEYFAAKTLIYSLISIYL